MLKAALHSMLDVIVINRLQDIDRLAFMTAQLDSLGVRFFRLDAFTPDTLPRAIPDRFWPRRPFAMSGPERACFLSHRTAWEWIRDRGPALVLEDDAILARQVPDLVRHLPPTGEIEHLTLEARGHRKLIGRRSIPIAHQVTAHRLYMDAAGSAAYILWPAGARRLLARAARDPAPVEGLIAGCGGLVSYQAVPALSLQLDISARYGLDLDIVPETAVSSLAPDRVARALRALVRPARMVRRGLHNVLRARLADVPVRAEFFD